MYPTLPDWAYAAFHFSHWHTSEELADKCAVVSKKLAAKPVTDRPYISYVLPAYNEEKHLLGTLLTLATQTLPGVEYIVVDNNSTDRTCAIATACGFTIVEEPRQGVTWARQAGLEAARGMIYASVDADTLYPPTHANAIQDQYAQNSDLVGTGGEYLVFFTQPRMILYHQLLDRLKGRTHSHKVFRAPGGCNSTYRRES